MDDDGVLAIVNDILQTEYASIDQVTEEELYRAYLILSIVYCEVKIEEVAGQKPMIFNCNIDEGNT